MQPMEPAQAPSSHLLPSLLKRVNFNISNESLAASLKNQYPLVAQHLLQLFNNLQLKNVFTAKKKLHILVLGSNYGYEVLALIQFFKVCGIEIHLTLIDSNQEAINACRKLFSDFSDINYVCADTTDLDYLQKAGLKANSFDLILLRNLHFDKAPEICSILLTAVVTFFTKDSGFILCSFATESELNVAKKLFCFNETDNTSMPHSILESPANLAVISQGTEERFVLDHFCLLVCFQREFFQKIPHAKTLQSKIEYAAIQTSLIEQWLGITDKLHLQYLDILTPYLAAENNSVLVNNIIHLVVYFETLYLLDILKKNPEITEESLESFRKIAESQITGHTIHNKLTALRLAIQLIDENINIKNLPKEALQALRSRLITEINNLKLEEEKNSTNSAPKNGSLFYRINVEIIRNIAVKGDINSLNSALSHEFLKARSLIDVPEKETQQTALHCAALGTSIENLQIVRILIANSANPCLLAKKTVKDNSPRYTALNFFIGNRENFIQVAGECFYNQALEELVRAYLIKKYGQDTIDKIDAGIWSYELSDQGDIRLITDNQKLKPSSLKYC